MTSPKSYNIGVKLLICLYAVCLALFIYIILKGSQNELINKSFGLALGSIPLVGGIYGLVLSKHWGSSKSALGKSLIFFSLGLISWSIGTYIFSGYYNLFANVEVPYPSIADVAYILSWPLWGIGILYLSKATGAKFGIKQRGGKSILFLIPTTLIALSYYLLIVVARAGVLDLTGSSGLKIFFDLFYPIGDVVILVLATSVYGLSHNYLGGKFKVGIYMILLGFILNYIADFFFSYTTTLETFYSGNWVDFLFCTTMVILSIGVVSLDPTVKLDTN